MRQMTEQEKALKAATFRAVHRLGGLCAAAEFVRVGKSTLDRYRKNDHPDCFVPVDIAIALDEAVGEPIISGAMARLFEADRQEQSPQAVFCNSTKEIGEFLGVLADALKDGKISPNEAKQILAESEDVRGVLDKVEILCARAG